MTRRSQSGARKKGLSHDREPFVMPWPWTPFALHEWPLPKLTPWHIRKLANLERKQHAQGLASAKLPGQALAIIAECLERCERGEAEVATTLSLIAAAALESLRHLETRGNALALIWRTVVLRSTVADLNEDARAHPDTFSAVFSVAPTFPVLYSPNPLFATDTRKMAEQIEHANLNIRDKRGARDFKTPATRLARRVYSCLLENAGKWQDKHDRRKLESYPELPDWVKQCKNLPEFSKASAERWFEVGWRAILYAYEGQPERQADLRLLVQPSMREQDPSRIRAAIKGALKLALLALTRK